jgi:hypothetical protein
MSLNDIFQDNKYRNMTDNELLDVLSKLSSETILNEATKHRAIVRAIVLSSELQQRYVNRIEKRNTFLTIIIIVLTLASLYKLLI